MRVMRIQTQGEQREQRTSERLKPTPRDKIRAMHTEKHREGNRNMQITLTQGDAKTHIEKTTPLTQKNRSPRASDIV